MSLGTFNTDDTVQFKFTSVSSGVPFALTGGTPGIQVWKDGSTTTLGTTEGVTLTTTFASIVGLNHVAVNLAADSTHYAAGGFYTAVLSTGATVDTNDVEGYVVGEWNIRADSHSTDLELLKTESTAHTTQLQTLTSATTTLSTDIDDLIATTTAIVAESTATAVVVDGIAAGTTALSTAVGDLQTSTTALMAGTTGLSTGQTDILAESTATAAVVDGIAAGTTTLSTDVDDLIASTTALTASTTAIMAGTTALSTDIADLQTSTTAIQAAVASSGVVLATDSVDAAALSTDAVDELWSIRVTELTTGMTSTPLALDVLGFNHMSQYNLHVTTATSGYDIIHTAAGSTVFLAQISQATTAEFTRAKFST